MRTLIAFLLLANLAFFYWANYVDRPVQRQLAPAIGDLQLVEPEVGPDAPRQLSEAPRPAESPSVASQPGPASLGDEGLTAAEPPESEQPAAPSSQAPEDIAAVTQPIVDPAVDDEATVVTTPEQQDEAPSGAASTVATDTGRAESVDAAGAPDTPITAESDMAPPVAAVDLPASPATSSVKPAGPAEPTGAPPRLPPAAPTVAAPDATDPAAVPGTALKPAASPGPPQETGDSVASLAETAATESEPDLSETTADVAAASAADVAPPAPSQEAQSSPAMIEDAPPDVCRRLGPLDDATAVALLQSLPQSVTVISDGVEDYDRDGGYFVMIPPLPTRTDALAMLRRLTAAGLDDTWLFRTGDYVNGISLGLFSREATARRHADDIAARGFPTEIRRRQVTEAGRFIRLRLPGTMDPATLPGVDNATEFPCP